MPEGPRSRLTFAHVVSRRARSSRSPGRRPSPSGCTSSAPTARRPTGVAHRHLGPLVAADRVRDSRAGSRRGRGTRRWTHRRSQSTSPARRSRRIWRPRSVLARRRPRDSRCVGCPGRASAGSVAPPRTPSGRRTRAVVAWLDADRSRHWTSS